MNNEVTIVRYEQPKVELFDNNGRLVGILNNDIELAKVQLQIVQKQLSGYFIRWKDKYISITSKGELENWPYGLYDEYQRTFAEMYQYRRNQTKA